MEPDKTGASSPQGEPAPKSEPAPTGAGTPTPALAQPDTTSPTYQPTVDDSYGYYDDPYAYESNTQPAVPAVVQEQPAQPPAVPPPPPPQSESKTPEPEPEDEEEDGMLRMSFLEHLEELRSRILKMLVGLGVAFLLSLTFSNQLWKIIQGPAKQALINLNIVPPKLVQNAPMEGFSIIWVKMPLLTAIFLASPWVLFQIWSFIAPGLYKKERRLAAPFILVSAGLFITGGLFAYFVAFRFALEFLIGIGRDSDLQTMITITYYFDLFVNVILGVALVFELPVVIFFLTLLRIASPRFLLANARYAILVITLLAAIITPTPDIFNMLLFAMPMWLLFFVGVFASYLLVLRRDGESFPWKKVLPYVLGVLAILGGLLWLAVTKYGYHLVPYWPFLTR